MHRRFSGQQLRALRLSRGLRPEHLALQIDRSAANLYGYETGRVIPSAVILGRLADALDCATDALFVETDQANAA